ncbi:MAG: NAD(P)-binding protein [Armatimonadetes bacterium]|nr:NAD(P)-binding protein [Armatimonadota bacterium]
MKAPVDCDVAIIGGGPAGSTAGCLLRKYAPNLRVTIFERERFPREHVGESQLPPISKVLDEMGAWDAVERAGFPIKIGATYRWGNSDKLWDFEFMPVKDYRDEPRPGRYEGQRTQLAFQVDRAIYDHILLQHAQSCGCEVHEGTKVASVKVNGDRVECLVLEDGTEVRARYYLDGSGNAGIMRRALGVEIDAPTKLRNVAFWDYWENAEWAVRFPQSATRVLVLSIGAGWIWYIPLSPTRTSIGFICPADYYKDSKRSPEEIYAWALSQEPLVSDLTKNAQREGVVRATKDWSFIAQRMCGPNWFLIGEAAGFADPILAAGLTLTHTSAREAAYTILELERGDLDSDWLRDQYHEIQVRRIGQHIRFADFWYSANGIFTDLQEYTTEIAKDAGLTLTPQKAFQWLGTGGFTDDVLGQVGIGGLDLAGARQVSQIFFAADFQWKLDEVNELRLNVDGAERTDIPVFRDGRIEVVPCWVRQGKRLPVTGLFAVMLSCVEKHKNIVDILKEASRALTGRQNIGAESFTVKQAVQVLEVMLGEGWIRGKLDPNKPRLQIGSPREGEQIHANVDLNARIESLIASTSGASD